MLNIIFSCFIVNWVLLYLHIIESSGKSVQKSKPNEIEKKLNLETDKMNMKIELLEKQFETLENANRCMSKRIINS